MNISKRIRALDIYERWALVCVAAAVLLRLVLIAFNWPYTDSDEGNMGVLALHVAFQGDHPVWFYGGNYLGPLEGYLAAPLFRLFGSSLFLLRLPLVLFFLLFLIGMYFLVRLLYANPKYALVAVLLLGLGSPDVLFLQLRASGEYPELQMLVALMCALGVWLALTTAQWWRPGAGVRWRRIGLYALLGALIGQALWVDLLAAPFVLALGVLLLAFCWRELLRWPGLSLVAGFIVGGLPLIYYNLTAPWSQNSWFVLRRLQASGEIYFLADHLTWVDRLAGSFFVSLPMATDGGWSCAPGVFPFDGVHTVGSVPCVVLQGGWSTGYVLLWLVATGAVLSALWRLMLPFLVRLKRVDAFRGDEEARQQLIRQSGRLVVLFGAGLTLLLYTASAPAAVASDTSFRYLTCLFLALPVLLWPLWSGLSQPRRAVTWWGRLALLLLVATILATGTIRSLMQMPATQARYEEQMELVHDLEQAGTTRLYSDYWSCNILIYLSDEKIICSAVGVSIAPALDRYMPYRSIVRAAPRPGYIFVSGSLQDQIMRKRLAISPAHFRVYRFFEYTVYQER